MMTPLMIWSTRTLMASQAWSEGQQHARGEGRGQRR